MLDHPTDTPIIAAYRRWAAVHAAAEAATANDDVARLSEEVSDLADRILDMPSVTPLDVLAKIAAQTLGGQCGLDACPGQADLIREAVAMVANASE